MARIIHASAHLKIYGEENPRIAEKIERAIERPAWHVERARVYMRLAEYEEALKAVELTRLRAFDRLPRRLQRSLLVIEHLLGATVTIMRAKIKELVQ